MQYSITSSLCKSLERQPWVYITEYNGHGPSPLTMQPEKVSNKIYTQLHPLPLPGNVLFNSLQSTSNLISLYSSMLLTPLKLD